MVRSPATWSLEDGLSSPIPRLPLLPRRDMRSWKAVSSEIENLAGLDKSDLVDRTNLRDAAVFSSVNPLGQLVSLDVKWSLETGVFVPIPTLPDASIRIRSTAFVKTTNGRAPTLSITV
jgi:hypothetical protein